MEISAALEILKHTLKVVEDTAIAVESICDKTALTCNAHCKNCLLDKTENIPEVLHAISVAIKDGKCIDE